MGIKFRNKVYIKTNALANHDKFQSLSVSMNRRDNIVLVNRPIQGRNMTNDWSILTTV